MTIESFEAEIDRLTRELIEAGSSEDAAHASRASLRRKIVGLVDAAATNPDAGMPLLMDAAEIERLHAIAYNAALQTGAKDQRLDELTASLFRQLAASVSRSLAASMNRREALRVVQ